MLGLLKSSAIPYKLALPIINIFTGGVVLLLNSKSTEPMRDRTLAMNATEMNATQNATLDSNITDNLTIRLHKPSSIVRETYQFVPATTDEIYNFNETLVQFNGLTEPSTSTSRGISTSTTQLLISTAASFTSNSSLTATTSPPESTSDSEPVPQMFVEGMVRRINRIRPRDFVRRLATKLIVPTDASRTAAETIELRFDPTLELYVEKESGRPIVWTFWDYRTMPAYIRLSLDTIFCYNNRINGTRVALLDNLISERILSPLPAAYKYLLPSHKADFIRGQMLLHYGGMWIDADTVMFDQVRSLFDNLKDYDIYGYNWTPENATIGITILGPIKAMSPLMVRWNMKVREVLSTNLNQLKQHDENPTTNPYPIRWGGLLTQIIQPIMDQLLANKQISYKPIEGLDSYGQLMKFGLNKSLMRKVSQLSFGRIMETFKSTGLLIYHNNEIHTGWKNIKDTRIFLNSDVLLSRLLKFALNSCPTNKL